MEPVHQPEEATRLDDMNKPRREQAFQTLLDSVRSGQTRLPADERPGNLHAHTFFSYNSQAWSPTGFAWRARTYGMEVAGLVDFDVLDGLDEFHAAGRALDLRTVVSLETRVFVPEFADRVINSPGEPGVAYHMACGFPSVPAGSLFLADLRARSERRNRELVRRVNAVLGLAAIDYDQDVLPLTPAGNATERHIVAAYARKAASRFSGDELARFWTETLGQDARALDLPDGPKLHNLIRAKTMKQGGAGYIKPDAHSFPAMADFNRFALACGAIPTVTWLDGASAGEQAMTELAQVAASSGAAAINIIPDRNFTPGVADQKLKNLYAVMELARGLHWPVIAGTEMNSPGQRFVDNFECAELKPLVEDFRRGAFILYAHTVLQRIAGLGYLSPWAERHLPRREDRNDFFADAGRALSPKKESKLAGMGENETPASILGKF